MRRFYPLVFLSLFLAFWSPNLSATTSEIGECAKLLGHLTDASLSNIARWVKINFLSRDPGLDLVSTGRETRRMNQIASPEMIEMFRDMPSLRSHWKLLSKFSDWHINDATYAMPWVGTLSDPTWEGSLRLNIEPGQNIYLSMDHQSLASAERLIDEILAAQILTRSRTGKRSFSVTATQRLNQTPRHNLDGKIGHTSLSIPPTSESLVFLDILLAGLNENTVLNPFARP